MINTMVNCKSVIGRCVRERVVHRLYPNIIYRSACMLTERKKKTDRSMMRNVRAGQAGVTQHTKSRDGED